MPLFLPGHARFGYPCSGPPETSPERAIVRRERSCVGSHLGATLEEMESSAQRLTRALAGRSDIHFVLLFGSHARGTAGPSSDVDVALQASPEVDRLALARDLSRALDREVDVIDLEAAGIPLLEEILRDGVLVHEGRASSYGNWRSKTLATLETDRPWFARMRDAWLRRVAERGLRG